LNSGSKGHCPFAPMPKDVRRLLIFLLAVGLPCGGFVIWRRVDDWVSERKWAEYVAAARSRGVKLTLEEFFVDPHLAAEENYAASPLWDRAFVAGTNPSNIVPALPQGAKPLNPNLTWGRIDLPDTRARMAEAKWISSKEASLTDAEAVLSGLQRFRTEFDELRSLRPRTRAWYPVKWRNAYSADYPHLSVIKNLHPALAMKARAEMELGRPGEAFETLQDAFQLASSLDPAPNFISTLMSSAIDFSIVRELREGIARGSWTNEQLEGLQKLFTSRNALARLKAATDGERALFNTMIEPIAAELIGRFYVPTADVAPLGLPEWAATGRARWWRGNQQWVNQSFDEEITAYHAEAETWKPPPNRSDSEPFPNRDHLQLAHAVLPPFVSWQRRGVFAHAVNRMSMIACALERFKRAQGQYPGELDALQPKFLSQLPRDPATGNLFQYRREGDTYRLYSAGLNGIDDGGTGDVFMDQREDRVGLADWAWPGPISAAESR
jgi:hypothetical protein